MIRVALIEDHPVFRQGLAQILDESPDVAIVVVAASTEEFVAKHFDVDVSLLDLHLPGISGPDAVRLVCERGSTVLVLSATGTSEDVLGAIEAGASGYLTKQAQPSEIVAAVMAVAAGDTYVSPTLASFFLDAAQQTGHDQLDLTPREHDVLTLVASGERDQDIADRLFISVRTVHSHLDRIRDKTGHRRRSELTRLALESGYITDEHPRA